jgi:hypothetical protein
VNSIAWSTDSDVPAYNELTEKLQTLMKKAGEEHLSDPQDIVAAIYSLAMRQSNQFRTLVGDMSKYLMDLRSKVPIEEYLSTMAANF